MGKTAAVVELAEELLDAVRIEPTVIEEEFIRLPGDMAYWNERFAMATHDYLDAKATREKLWGELLNDSAIFDALAKRLGKKPSVDQLKGEIETLDQYVGARQLENTAKADVARTRGNVDCVIAKKEMLISLGAHIRAELNRDAMIREKES